MTKGEYKTATFAAGCFWCGEAVFQRIKGVKKVVSGYSGGDAKTAKYEDVSSGRTDHVEAFQVTYDPKEISYGELLDVFWSVHDPTQEDGQGNDIGPQYRAVIFYDTEEEGSIAERSKQELQKEYTDPIATAIRPFENFFPAEEYHSNYYNTHQNAPYCRVVISPKIEKVKKLFKEKVEKE